MTKKKLAKQQQPQKQQPFTPSYFNIQKDKSNTYNSIREAIDNEFKTVQQLKPKERKTKKLLS